MTSHIELAEVLGTEIEKAISADPRAEGIVNLVGMLSRSIVQLLEEKKVDPSVRGYVALKLTVILSIAQTMSQNPMYETPGLALQFRHQWRRKVVKFMKEKYGDK